MNKINDTTLLNNEARITELQKQLEESNKEQERLKNLLQQRVD